jgi:hypothetical protein
MKVNRIVLTALLSLLLNGCLIQPAAPVFVRGERIISDSPAPEQGINTGATGQSQIKPRPQRAMPIQAINIKNECRFADEAGTKGQMDLFIEEASVKQFKAEVKIPRYGTCRFDLKDFQQTAKLPAAVLLAKQGHCSVRVWQQDSQVTVAFTACENQCTGDAFSYLWPILTDTRTGECA